MSQHDYVIANASGAVVRADLNSLFQAMLSQNSGTSAPTTTAAGMFWLDTTGGAPYTLKVRDAGNNHWLTVLSLTDPGSDGDVELVAPLVTKGGTGQTSWTQGDLLYASGANALGKLDKGAASQVLQMNSGATAPEWATATSAPLVFIKTETHPSSTTWLVEDCFSATYPVHMIVISDLTLSSASSVTMVLVDESGSPVTAANYDWVLGGARAGGVSYVLGTNNIDLWRLAQDQEGLDNPLSAILYVYGVFNSAVSPTIVGSVISYSDSYALLGLTMSGRYNVTSSTNYDGFRLTASGTIDGGRISVYGIRNS